MRRPRFLLIWELLMLYIVALTLTWPSARSSGMEQETVKRLTQVLRERMPPEKDVGAREMLARRQVAAAAALAKIGRYDLLWPMMRQSADSSRRTYLIRELGLTDIDPAILFEHLEMAPETSVRRALILSLGGFNSQQIASATRQQMVNKLLGWYRDDPDPGVHAAIDWLLRYGIQGAVARNLDWRQGDMLSEIDLRLAEHRQERRDWYVTREGQTMVVLHGPMEFRMGSPVHESGRVSAPDSPDEPLHRVHIPRSFAISSKEITVRQFRRFLEANPDVRAKFAYPEDPGRMSRILRTFSPDDECPQIAVTWYEAAMYCNWLSSREGIPQSEWVYPTNFDQIGNGMMMPKNYLHRKGYRLPTEAEWEYAARAGSTTARFYGSGDEVLEEYAWYSKNPPKVKTDPIDPTDPQRTWPVGQLKPNDFGLFDVYGNVWEWCQDRMQQLSSGDSVAEDGEDQVLRITNGQARSRRGGAFPYGAAAQRSAGRGTVNAFPMLRRDNVGFRVVRTYR